MTDIADLYLQLGSAGFIAVLFGFMIYNLIQSQKEQSEDLESIKQSEKNFGEKSAMIYLL